MLIYGINPVGEALRAGRARELRVSSSQGRLADLLRLAGEQRIPVRHVSKEELDRAVRGGMHQGVAALLREQAAVGVGDLVRGAAVAPLILVLDGIEDPQNLGAILRSADA